MRFYAIAVRAVNVLSTIIILELIKHVFFNRVTILVVNVLNNLLYMYIWYPVLNELKGEVLMKTTIYKCMNIYIDWQNGIHIWAHMHKESCIGVAGLNLELWSVLRGVH